MGKHFSNDIKNEIIKKYINHETSLVGLEKEYGISYKTIFNWLRKYRKNGTVENDIAHKRGRPK